MARLEENISVFDFIITKNGNVNGLLSFMSQNGIETLNDNLLGKEVEPYGPNSFSENLKINNRLIATRELTVTGSTVGAYTSGYSDGYDINK
jgi:hypothetical protein